MAHLLSQSGFSRKHITFHELSAPSSS